MEAEWFYDSNNHLNTAGAARYTAWLLEALDGPGNIAAVCLSCTARCGQNAPAPDFGVPARRAGAKRPPESRNFCKANFAKILKIAQRNSAQRNTPAGSLKAGRQRVPLGGMLFVQKRAGSFVNSSMANTGETWYTETDKISAARAGICDQTDGTASGRPSFRRVLMAKNAIVGQSWRPDIGHQCKPGRVYESCKRRGAPRYTA